MSDFVRDLVWVGLNKPKTDAAVRAGTDRHRVRIGEDTSQGHVITTYEISDGAWVSVGVEEIDPG